MNSEQTELRQRRAQVHAALGDVHRLQIVDLLATTDASSSEIGAATGLPSNLLAHHLNTLENAGLVTRRRSEGDRRRSYLSLNRHEAWLVPDHGADLGLPAARRVVFVCTANTARSHLAAALWRRASPVDATSAGTHPGDRINPGALAAARRHHLELPDVAPRFLGDTVGDDDLVITVCDRAHEEIGDAARVHWSVPDPVPGGTRASFDAALDALAERVEALAPTVAQA
jgi:ArsR family transcriptional regulator, arsenate/arsenite/antimonite-responsive transcriptional repressor / arsenate reductase (thioredoxin)